MRQLQIIAPGQLQIAQTTKPIPEDGEVLIKVKTAGLNRIDLLMIDGAFKVKDGAVTPGLEVYGVEVESGKKVIALIPSGGFSEYVVVPKIGLIEAELPLSDDEFACLPEALAVAQHALLRFVEKKGSDPILIHGGASGIGSFLIQVASMYSDNVIATVGEDNKIDFCKSKGAKHVINYKTQSFEEVCKQLGGAQLAIDILGGQYFEQTLNSLNYGGRVMVMAVMNGNFSNLNLSSVLMKNLKIEGMTLKDKPIQYKAGLIRDALAQLAKSLTDQKISVIIDSTFGFDDYEKAFEKMRNRGNLGKIVLKIS